VPGPNAWILRDDGQPACLHPCPDVSGEAAEVIFFLLLSLFYLIDFFVVA